MGQTCPSFRLGRQIYRQTDTYGYDYGQHEKIEKMSVLFIDNG